MKCLIYVSPEEILTILNRDKSSAPRESENGSLQYLLHTIKHL